MVEAGFATERLIMCRWLHEHVQAWFTIFGDPEVTRLTFGAPHPDLACSRRVLESTMRKSEREHPFGWWAVRERTRGAIIGTIGLNAMPNGGMAALGYHFRRAVWGKGYATEVVRAMVAYGFGPGGYVQILADIHPENGASRRVLEKSGFRVLDTVADDGLDRERFALTRRDALSRGFLGDPLPPMRRAYRLVDGTVDAKSNSVLSQSLRTPKSLREPMAEHAIAADRAARGR